MIIVILITHGHPKIVGIIIFIKKKNPTIPLPKKKRKYVLERISFKFSMSMVTLMSGNSKTTNIMVREHTQKKHTSSKEHGKIAIQMVLEHSSTKMVV
jgi:hypothetical protein